MSSNFFKKQIDKLRALKEEAFFSNIVEFIKSNKHRDLEKLLIKNDSRYDINKNFTNNSEGNVLNIALKLGDAKCIKMLLDNGANPLCNIDGFSILSQPQPSPPLLYWFSNLLRNYDYRLNIENFAEEDLDKTFYMLEKSGDFVYHLINKTPSTGFISNINEWYTNRKAQSTKDILTQIIVEDPKNPTRKEASKKKI